MAWSFRPMAYADLPELVVMQERGAVAGLSNVFPQDAHPFPRETIRSRWREELADPDIAAYVATEGPGHVVGFAARRGDELLHFGTAVETWGSGLATWLHDELVATYPRELRELRLRVFTENRRGRRFYEKLGWKATGLESRTSFPPHPTLLEYRLDRTGPVAAG
jgi:RimJ/RimL family protein N-acetyltransferase